MSTRIPKRLKLRPHWRGLPIPYVAMIGGDGRPDFRVTDEVKRRSVMLNRCCQLCGQPLGKYIFFTGGTEAAAANAYFEPAAHLDCLIYAMQVCPFIAGKIEHADLAKAQAEYAGREAKRIAGGVTLKADDTFSAVRNPWWIIKKAMHYSYRRTPDKTVLLVPEVILKATTPLHPETMTTQDWARVMKVLESEN
jgi:hypothetical protein